MSVPTLAHLPPLGRHYADQLYGLSCVLCAEEVPASTPPLAEVPARYGDYRFTYRPKACPACAPLLPRPVQLPALEVEPPAVIPGDAL
ncbi:hypothetical protein ACFYY3_33130 [Streptomyces sp. NPDC001812]|uniref:hypothetical protein n=1 Tax=Streptomyces sp. NPDC001812 TaxID=3364611 RepID=UPI0036A49E54